MASFYNNELWISEEKKQLKIYKIHVSPAISLFNCARIYT